MSESFMGIRPFGNHHEPAFKLVWLTMVDRSPTKHRVALRYRSTEERPRKLPGRELLREESCQAFHDPIYSIGIHGASSHQSHQTRVPHGAPPSRVWLGTSDDWIGTTDRPSKQQGVEWWNLVGNRPTVSVDDSDDSVWTVSGVSCVTTPQRDAP